MPRYIVKVGERYGEWSTIVDAPVTYLMPLERFTTYYQSEYGNSRVHTLAPRMERVEAKGTSSMLDDSAVDVVVLNRYGPHETELTPSEVFAKWNRESDAYWAERGK